MSQKRIVQLTTFMGLLTLGLAPDCTDNHGGDDSTSSDDTSSTDDTSTDDTAISDITATVQGTVCVQLYDDRSGVRELVDWADAGFVDDFPYGKIFIAGSNERETPGRDYYGDTTIDSPSMSCDAYEMEVELDGTDTLQVFGQLDYYVDRVLGTGDPIGFHDGLVTVTDGGTVTGVDITILAHVPVGGGGCGGDGSTINIGGDVIIPMSYAGGDVAVWLDSTSGTGPHYASWFTPTAATRGDGAETPYSLTVCPGLGEMRLKGGWDRNGNELIDPRDRFGAYSTAPDTNSNPITVGGTDLTAYDVQIPIDGVEGFEIVPFTSLSGTLTMESGLNFDEELSDESVVYVAALKYRPNSDLAVSDMEDFSYGTNEWSWAEVQGQSSLDFTIPVPGNTIVYLWAYADSGDSGTLGIVNEVGEFVGISGSNSGRIPTGTDGASGLVMQLAQP